MKKNKLVNAVFYLVCMCILSAAFFIENSAVLLTLGVVGIISMHQMFDNLVEAFKKEETVKKISAEQAAPLPVPTFLPTPPLPVPIPVPQTQPAPVPIYSPPQPVPPIYSQPIPEQQPMTEQQAVQAPEFDASKFVCRYCQKELKSEMGLRRHIAFKHPEQIKI